MSLRKELANRIRYLWTRAEVEANLKQEVRLHIETRANELVETGVPFQAALEKARLEFGSETLAREDSRSAWQLRWLEDFVGDIRFVFRSYLRSPVFAMTAVLSIALGVGANTAIFTTLNTALWKPLPITDPQRLVKFSVSRRGGEEETDLPEAFAQQLRDSGIFAGVAIKTTDGLSFADGDRAERIMGEVVSPNFFDIVGVQPILGQGFTPNVKAGHWEPQAVLSYTFWKRRYGGDPNVIGRTIHLNTYPFVVVGVSPPGFFGLSRGTDDEIRIPILPDGQEVGQILQISGSGDHWVDTLARLRPFQSMGQAQTAADIALQRFLQTTPIEEFRSAGLLHLHVSSDALGDFERVEQLHAPLYVMFVLAGIVLLIACANVANMLVARSTARRREIAIRASIGAGRLRLVRQMLAESMLLFLLGGAFGMVIANWAMGLILRFVPQGHVSIVLDLHPDNRAFLFTFGIALLTGVFFGLPPALQATRGELLRTIRCDSAASIGEPRSTLRRVLLVMQVAFSLLLLIVAGTFVRTIADLRPSDFRGRPNRVLLFTIKPQQEIYTPERKRVLVDEILRRVSELPNVESAAFAENGALGSRVDRTTVTLSGHAPIRADEDLITPGFFDTIGIPRLAGRDFLSSDGPTTPPVAIVNQALTRALFSGQDSIGRKLIAPDEGKLRQYEIVGLVADSHYYDLHIAPRPGIWFPIMQDAPYMPTLHVRTAAEDGGGMIANVLQVFNTVDKGFPVFNIKTLQSRIDDSLSNERMVASFAAAFGGLALLLVGVGLYGILAYSVSRRTREIGIRMALGSTLSGVLRLIASEALALVSSGTLAGIIIALLSNQLLVHFFPGVSALSATSLIASAAVMFAVAALAVSVPAYRAARIDPVIALRHE